MKIKARVVFQNTPVYYDVPCGLGDKSFKWLGMTVCQRFALSNPNGGLRRRDPIRRGMSDNSLHQPVQMILSDGSSPHPLAMISDFMHDGDEVTIMLVDSLTLSTVTGLPQSPTKWSTLAFSTSGDGVQGDESKSAEGDLGADSSRGKSSYLGEVSSEQIQLTSHAEFMRTILRSQMINSKKIAHTVETHWRNVISKGMPMLAPAQEEALKAAFVQYWDVMLDLFERFAPDGKLSKSSLHSLFEDAALFSAKTLPVLAARIHRRACEATAPGQLLLELPGFMVAIMLAAQTLHNDTHDPKDPLAFSAPRAALDEVFSRNLYALAERLECFCVLKDIFTSDQMLATIRQYHSDLMDVFTKYATRSREMPISINVLNLSEMLYDGMLLDEKPDRNNTPASYLLTEIRKGTIHGRPVDPLLSPDDVPPDNEFTYPEMVEGICRHGFYKHRGTKPDEDGNKVYLDYVGDWSIRDCFEDALNGARKALRDPRAEDEGKTRRR